MDNEIKAWLYDILNASFYLPLSKTKIRDICWFAVIGGLIRGLTCGAFAFSFALMHSSTMLRRNKKSRKTRLLRGFFQANARQKPADRHYFKWTSDIPKLGALLAFFLNKILINLLVYCYPSYPRSDLRYRPLLFRRLEP